MTPPRILLFAGSLRRESYQVHLLRYLAERLHHFSESEVVLDILNPVDITLPLFNQDLETDPAIRTHVKQIYARFSAANGVIIASPEYNAQVSPFLKNTFDWISRLPRLEPPTPSPFKGKPLLLSCATTGWTGGIQGLAAARLLFAYLGFNVLATQINVSDAADWLTTEGFVFEERFTEHMDRALEELMTLTRRHLMPQECLP